MGTLSNGQLLKIRSHTNSIAHGVKLINGYFLSSNLFSFIRGHLFQESSCYTLLLLMVLYTMA